MKGLQGAANQGILDQPGALGDLCHTVPHLQLLDLGGDRKRGNQGVGRPPKMSLFEFQAGRPNCNPLLPQLSPLQASKICKLIPFLTKGDSGFIISSDCEGWTIGNYLSRRSSSRVQHGCKCGHPFIFVLLCFLLVCIFAFFCNNCTGCQGGQQLQHSESHIF